MKKTFITLIFIILICSSGFSQNASTFFPANPGYKWYYKNIPLDSINNPVQSLSRYRIDSFAIVNTYKGLLANIVRVKDNLLIQNQNTPYTDTNRHNFQGTDGWDYLSISFLPDSINIPVGFFNFLRSLQNWYDIYRFAQTVNQEYIVLQKDTAIAIDTISAPIRVKLKGKRLNDETISTVNGNYTAKKFLITYGLYLRVLFLEFPIIERPDTTWIAPDVWMVKQVTPSTALSLAQLGINLTIPIPGNVYELTIPVGIRKISTEVPDKYNLFQNYPNPFNPNTIIKFMVAENGKSGIENGNVTLKIYDMIGREVTTLVNEKLQPGTYEIPFSSSQIASGIYFYKLEAGNFSDVKRMIMVK